MKEPTPLNEPIPLNEARRRAKSIKAANDHEGDVSHDLPLPLTPLGHADGKFYFLNIVGERRALTARQLNQRADLGGLFLGDLTWLKKTFPSAGDSPHPAGFQINKATDYLMQICRETGIFGDHVIIRKPGVWAGEAGRPIAHCGDAVFFDGQKLEPGVKLAGQIFATAAHEVYPAEKIAPAATGVYYRDKIKSLWRLRDDGSEIIILGLIGQAYLSGALSWRANGFFSGSGGSGKSNLLNFTRALTPLNHYTNDTSKAGIEGAVSGRALPVFIDEGSDRANGDASMLLMDIVLSASSGAGTKGHRGTADGGVRSIELVGSVIMASITPPMMQPQHRSRFAIVELLKPAAGVDHAREMSALVDQAKIDGPALFARALAGFERFKIALNEIRFALGQTGCVAREMDLLGAILAGFWILTDDGTPADDDAQDLVKQVAAFIRGADEMQEEDSGQAVIAMLTTSTTPLDRTSDLESIGNLISTVMLTDSEHDAQRQQATRALDRIGIRCIRAIDGADHQNSSRSVPRGAPGNGIWLDPGNSQLAKIFEKSVYAGKRWLIELQRVDGYYRAVKAVRLNPYRTAKAIWLNWDKIDKGTEIE